MFKESNQRKTKTKHLQSVRDIGLPKPRVLDLEHGLRKSTRRTCD